MQTSSYVTSSTGNTVLTASPITPEWIMAGKPQARSAEVARSSDGASNTMIWDCTAGTFRWYFGVDETVHIIAGDVTVSDDYGHRRTLRAGDIGFFPAGTWMTWQVDNYVRKIAFLRHPLPQPFGICLRAFNFGLNWLRLRMSKPAVNNMRS